MRTRGTIEINSQDQKVFVPELSCDIFIGAAKPNQDHIDRYGLIYFNPIGENENDIVWAEVNYFSKNCHLVEFDI